MRLRHRERIEVYHNGEEITVWNALNVDMPYQIRGSKLSKEAYPDLATIEIIGGGPQPDYVTEWIAEELWHVFGIDDLDVFGIEVIDVEADDVERL